MRDSVALTQHSDDMLSRANTKIFVGLLHLRDSAKKLTENFGGKDNFSSPTQQLHSLITQCKSKNYL